MMIIGNGGHAKVVRNAIANDSLALPDRLWIIAVGDNAARKSEATKLPDDSFVAVIHNKAVIANDVRMGDGTVVMAGAVVQPGTVIGKHCIINTCASVDHDCTLGDFVHVAPGARLCGNVTVGEGALIGAGAVCVPGAVIAPWSLVKAGSVAK